MLRWIKPVGLDEQPQSRVVVPRVEVLLACVGVETLAGVALGFACRGEAERFVKSLTIGRVGGGFDKAAVCCGDQFNRAELVLVQVFSYFSRLQSADFAYQFKELRFTECKLRPRLHDH